MMRSTGLPLGLTSEEGTCGAKDGKYNRPEALAQRNDEDRLEHGGRLFDHRLAYFSKKRR
jgi:hypothetical protein